MTLCLVMLSLSGCVPGQQIEQLGIITSYGVDLLDEEEGTLDNTILYTQFDPEAPQPMQTIESTSSTYLDAISAANLKTSYKLVTGHISLKLFGKEMAEKGIMRLLSPHLRDAEEPANIYIAVGEPTAKEILMSKGITDVSKFLDQLFENNIREEILPKSNFMDFVHNVDDPGVDPIQPVITIKNDKPVIDQIGLFQQDQYVASISPDETFLVKLIIEDFRAGKREIILPRAPFDPFIQNDTDEQPKEDLYLTLDEIRSSADISLEDKKQLHYQVNVDLEARLMESSEPIKIDSDKVLNLLETEMSRKFEEQYEQLTNKLKELNVDPIGFGTHYNAETKHEDLTDEKWRELFPTTTINYNVNVNIIRHGVIE